MSVKAIALPLGADLLWIKLGNRLADSLGGLSDELVELIIEQPDGFVIYTRSASRGRERVYNVARRFASRIELPSGDIVRPTATSYMPV
jgi:hypothetical protein